jgi:hypothetical protein
MHRCVSKPLGGIYWKCPKSQRHNYVKICAVLCFPWLLFQVLGAVFPFPETLIKRALLGDTIVGYLANLRWFIESCSIGPLSLSLSLPQGCGAEVCFWCNFWTNKPSEEHLRVALCVTHLKFCETKRPNVKICKNLREMLKIGKHAEYGALKPRYTRPGKHITTLKTMLMIK